MNWDKDLIQFNWAQEITHYEEKLAVGKRIASMVKDGDVIGFGSGSTSFLAVQEIGKRVRENGLNIKAIPTSHEIEMVCASLGIPTATVNEVKPDWCFDGADEVNEEGWLIKGRGGAMYKEKLTMTCSSVCYILVDSSKLVKNLGEKFPVPVECFPSAYVPVLHALRELDAKCELRLAGNAKDGPVITENGNYIIDAKFSTITRDLEVRIKAIVGVVESGLFIGFPVKVIKV